MDFQQMPIKDVALYYRNVGLMPIPVKEKKSVISWKDFQHNIAPEKTVSDWFQDHKDGGLALLTGPVSQVIVLDLDGKEAIERIKQTYSIPKTWIAETRKGMHLYFKWSPGINVSTTIVALAGMQGVDLRGRGGYVVAPPSYGVYKWLPGYSPWEIGLSEIPEWLKSLINKHNEKLGATGKRELGAGWLSELLEGVGSGQRHAAFIKLAGYYLSRMPSDIAYYHLKEWNEKNTPPIPEQEFEQQFKDIEKRYASGQYRSTYNTPQQQIQTESKPLAPISINHLLDTKTPDVKWLVRNLIPAQTTTILGGWQGLGKSWLALDLAIEMSRGGGRWLDVHPVEGGKVLYIDEESTVPLLKYRLKKLIKGKGIGSTPLNLDLAIGKRFKFTNPSSLDRLKELLDKTRPTLVVVDSLIRVHHLEENSSKDMAHFFDDIIKPLTQDYGCSFLFIDHEGKGFPGLPLQAGGKRLRGSSAKGDAIDTMLSLKRTDKHLVLEHSKARFYKPVETIAVSIDDIASDATKVVSIGTVGG